MYEIIRIGKWEIVKADDIFGEVSFLRFNEVKE